MHNRSNIVWLLINYNIFIRCFEILNWSIKKVDSHDTIKYLLSAQCNKEQLVTGIAVYFSSSSRESSMANELLYNDSWKVQATNRFFWTGNASLLSDLADRLISCASIKPLTRAETLLSENKMQIRREWRVVRGKRTVYWQLNMTFGIEHAMSFKSF